MRKSKYLITAGAFALVAVSGILLSGCGNKEEETAEREIESYESDAYIFYFPEEYKKSEFLSPDEESRGVYYEFSDYTKDISGHIDVFVEQGFPTDTNLDATMCNSLSEDLKLWDDDTIEEVKSSQDGDVQKCEVYTTIEESGKLYNIFLYYRLGDTSMYQVTYSYSKDTPEEEGEYLKEAADKFEIK